MSKVTVVDCRWDESAFYDPSTDTFDMRGMNRAMAQGNAILASLNLLGRRLTGRSFNTAMSVYCVRIDPSYSPERVAAALAETKRQAAKRFDPSAHACIVITLQNYAITAHAACC